MITTITAAAYNTVPLDDAMRGANGTWIVELVSDTVLSPPGEKVRDDFWPGYWPIKLIDGSTGRPIANASVYVRSGKSMRFDVKTNARGYVFVPNDKIIRLGDIEHTSVSVAGFRRKKVGDGEANRKITLEKE
jgi:hypothetical protein